MTEQSTSEPFDQFAVVEIMGHQRYAGRVTEQTIGGCSFVRIDVPPCGNNLGFTKLFGQSSIFSITPCSEAVAKQAAAQCYTRPIEIYSPSVQPRLDYDCDEDDP